MRDKNPFHTDKTPSAVHGKAGMDLTGVKFDCYGPRHDLKISEHDSPRAMSRATTLSWDSLASDEVREQQVGRQKLYYMNRHPP